MISVLWFQPLRQFQNFTELFDWLINRKPGRIGSAFKQHPAWLAEVDRMKVIAVWHIGDTQARRAQRCLVIPLGGVIRDAKSDVTDRTGPEKGAAVARPDHNIKMLPSAPEAPVNR